MGLDTQVLVILNSVAGQSPFLDGMIVFFASYLAYLLAALFLALLFFSQYPKREKMEIFLVTAISTLVARFGVTELIRFVSHRPRPYLVLPIHTLLTDAAWSLPSGHAAFFFALATAVYLYHKKWGVFFFIAAALMTVSRVIAGIHYPSDIIAGAAVGVAVAYATFYIVRKIFVAGQSV